MHNLIDHLFTTPIASGYGDRIVVNESGQTYSYQQLFDSIKACAASDKWDAFNAGDVVACVLPDSVELITVFFALIYRGLIPCLLNTTFLPSAYVRLLSEAKCVAVVSGKAHANHIHNIADEMAINYVDIDVFSTPKLGENAPERGYCDVAFCLFSSGTTGKPSLVQHRHQDVVVMNDNYGKQVLGLCEDDVIYATSRLYFAYGLNALFFALLNKAQFIVPLENLQIQQVWDVLSTYQPTVFFSVPTVYNRMLQDMPTDVNLHKIRACVSAGENLPFVVFERWQSAVGLPIIDGIGTTEILSTFISNRLDAIKPGSTGKPVDGFSIKLKSLDDGSDVAQGDIGVLWVKGHTYVDYYPNDAVKSQVVFSDGWFKTNDLFSVDEEGYYFYHGRANDLIKVSGIWVYPYKIEKAMLGHEAVKEVIVRDEKDDADLMCVAAYIVLADPYVASEALIRKLKTYAKQTCSRYEYPRYIHFVDSIPKTPSGKYMRRALMANNFDYAVKSIDYDDFEHCPNDYQKYIKRILAIQAFSERSGACEMGVQLHLAPNAMTRKGFARVVYDEANHALMLYRILEKLGVSEDEALALAQSKNSKGQATESLEGVMSVGDAENQWLDIVLNNMFLDRAGAFMVGNFAQSSFKPWAEACKKIYDDEQMHKAFGWNQLKIYIDKHGVSDELKEKITCWYIHALNFFGPPNVRSQALLYQYGIKRQSNEELRQAFVAEVLPMFEEIGLRDVIDQPLTENYPYQFATAEVELSH